jgi:acetoacetyl-CoA synthetase
MHFDGEIVWTPGPDARQATNVGRYMDWLERERGLKLEGYHDLWRWSVDELPAFWESIVRYFGIAFATPPEKILGATGMPGAEWFPGATLNFAEHLLRGDDPDRVVVHAVSQTRPTTELTLGALREQVAALRATLAARGVGPGDRVCACLPNIPETLVAFLATASLGAIWAVCPPEFGTRSVLDRLGQLSPKALFVVDGYRYGDAVIDRRDAVAELRAALPTVETTIAVPYLHDDPAAIPGAVAWDAAVATPAQLHADPVAFDHPLWVVFSSGTTGLPKPIVHGHGGALVELVKALSLHHDMRAGDRLMFFTTTGWMMWNVSIATLLVGASYVAVDGNPTHPDLAQQWRTAAEAGVTNFGAGSAYLALCSKAGLTPTRDFDLRRVRTLMASGSPLPAHAYRWIAEQFGPAVFPYAASGGTDVISGFVTGVPLLPTRAGTMAGRFLGVDAHAFDPEGRPVTGELGELVITKPMPSMPIGFWGDEDGSVYRSSYFDTYPGVWRHGDWVVFDEHGESVIVGRSDATLNRGGVRLGTSEFYAQVEALPAVADALVVHLEDADGGLGELLLFVQPAAGAVADDALEAEIRSVLRTALSPRHVPDRIVGVHAIPRTLTGKKLEVPVKRILQGAPPETVVSPGALADPDALDDFVRFAERRAAPTA